MSTHSLYFSEGSFDSQMEEDLPSSITFIGGSLDESEESIGTEKSVSPKSSKPTAIVPISVQTFQASSKYVNSDRHLMISSTSSPKPLRSKKPSTRLRKGQPKRSLSTYSFTINSNIT